MKTEAQPGNRRPPPPAMLRPDLSLIKQVKQERGLPLGVASGLPAGGGCRMMMPRRRQQQTGGGMSAKSKVYSSFEDAVRDIPDGATLGFGGFAVVGMPINLYQAVARQGAKNLTCVSNSTRGGATLPADAPDMSGLIRNNQ